MTTKTESRSALEPEMARERRRPLDHQNGVQVGPGARNDHQNEMTKEQVLSKQHYLFLQKQRFFVERVILGIFRFLRHAHFSTSLNKYNITKKKIAK